MEHNGAVTEAAVTEIRDLGLPLDHVSVIPLCVRSLNHWPSTLCLELYGQLPALAVVGDMTICVIMAKDFA